MNPHRPYFFPLQSSTAQRRHSRPNYTLHFAYKKMPGKICIDRIYEGVIAFSLRNYLVHSLMYRLSPLKCKLQEITGLICLWHCCLSRSLVQSSANICSMVRFIFSFVSQIFPMRKVSLLPLKVS